MGPAINTLLGLAFVGIGFAATLAMFWLRGRPGAAGGVLSPEGLAADVPRAAASATPATVPATRVEGEAELPRIAGTRPVRIALEPGSHFWCSCGKSRSQPFCDGSHRGTGFQPLEFTVEGAKKAALCLCKRTGKAPYCDGSHTKLDKLPATAGDAAEPAAAPAPAPRNTPEEPALEMVHALARDGLTKTGSHGEMAAMGVPCSELPRWGDLQILTAQLARRPLFEDAAVSSELVIGPRAARPLSLRIPLLVTDMSFGALSEEAKTALAGGAEQAGTGICSGEGGMLPEEQAANSRYLFELGSAAFGYSEALLEGIQAFHFKAGQAAKTGIGGHLPGSKVQGKIARLRRLPEGQPAVSPATFADLVTPDDFRRFSDRVRERSGGIPIGMKMSAQHIEADIDFALASGVDYLVLDGRGGGTGAAPLLFRNHISVPTLPALARARRHLDRRGCSDITLIVTGGLRTPADFVKALCLGADGVALGNAAMQAIGCVGARICNTNHCPAGIATQRAELRARLDIETAAARLARFLTASVELMKALARGCGHDRLDRFSKHDLSAWDRQTAELTGVAFAGDSPPEVVDSV